jgi:hypothetical protein
MSEEEIGQPTETTPEPAEAPEQEAPEEAPSSVPAAEEAKPEAAPYDWRKALDEAPYDEIRKHPKFSGFVGTEKARWQQEYDVQQKAKTEAETRQALEHELEELARQNPVAFADKWLGDTEAKKAQERLTGLETKARQDIAAQVGAALHTVEEWAGVIADPDALAAFTMAPAGKPPEEVIPAVFGKAVDLVAERRARARFEKWKADELPKEREALKAEITAELLSQSDRPDLVRAAARARRGSWEDLDPGPEFDREYERNVLRR